MKINLNKIKEWVISLFKDIYSVYFELIKIMVPVSIILKILKEFNLIEKISGFFAPVMNIIGLPGETALIFGTAFLSNIYGAMIILFNLSNSITLSYAELSALCLMILTAHAFPVEISICKKSGVSAVYMIILRLVSAVFIGFITLKIYNVLNIYSETAKILYTAPINDPSFLAWLISELKNYLFVFVIISSLIFIVKLMKLLKILDLINIILTPFVKFMGISTHSIPAVIAGMTLGLGYGGGLIINESKAGFMTKKDVFLTISLLGLFHSVIEDSLLMVSLGATIDSVYIIRPLMAFIIYFIIKFFYRGTTLKNSPPKEVIEEIAKED